MSVVLLDTNAWVGNFVDDPRLSSDARSAMASASGVRVVSVSFFKIGQKIRAGEWPAMEPFQDKLPDILQG